MLAIVRRIAGRPIAERARRLARTFLEQTQRAEEVQRDLLLSMVRRHAESQFGRDHHFGEIRGVEDFRRRVPIRDYAGHEPYIAQVRAGRLDALFGRGTEVLMFALTSGTTATPKTIPVTRESLQAYRDGWRIWGIQAFDAHKPIIEKGLKPILQLVSDWRERFTDGGIPCGAITGLTAQMQNLLVRQTYCMPPASMQVKDIESKYYLALRLALPRDLGALMAANPSTLLGIARLGDREAECLIRDLAQGTLDRRWDVPDPVRQAVRRRLNKRRRDLAKQLEKLVATHGKLRPRDYWPNLCLVANWTGGTMGAHLKHYPDWFGETPVRDIGLIASEGRFTIPIEDFTPAGVLDIRHHFFEFLPEAALGRDDAETRLAHELTPGERYYILPTTAGGLYRYQIHDLVRCAGYHGQAPLIEFLNKGAHFSSLTGEKLSEFQVVHAVNEAAKQLGLRLTAYLLLPRWEGDLPGYELLVEDGDLPDPGLDEKLAREVEQQLARVNIEYENKRETQRLAPLRVGRVAPGSWLDYKKRRLAQSGGTAEQYKQPCLVSDPEVGAGFARVG